MYSPGEFVGMTFFRIFFSLLFKSKSIRTSYVIEYILSFDVIVWLMSFYHMEYIYIVQMMLSSYPIPGASFHRLLLCWWYALYLAASFEYYVECEYYIFVCEYCEMYHESSLIKTIPLFYNFWLKHTGREGERGQKNYIAKWEVNQC